MYKNTDQYYEMKYYKYKAKIQKLKGGSNQENKLNLALIRNKNIDEIERLLKNGATVNGVYDGVFTPLTFIIYKQFFNMEKFRLLVQYSSSETINRKDGYNNTILHRVLQNHKHLKEHLVEILELLLDKGAIESFNEQNIHGQTIIYLACHYDLFNVVRFLLDYESEHPLEHSSSGARKPNNIVNIPSGGNTPLYIACRNGNIELVRYLLNNGAIASINEGKKDSDNVANVLRTYENGRREISLTEYDGYTPLFIAYLKNDLELVELLLLYGANPEIPQLNETDIYNKMHLLHSMSYDEFMRIYNVDPVDVNPAVLESEFITRARNIDEIIYKTYNDEQYRIIYTKGAKCK